MPNDTHAFIVRIWYEAEDEEGKGTVWRGSIDHVGSKNRLYFHDLGGIVRFIQEQTDLEGKQRTTWWRSAWSRFKHVVRGEPGTEEHGRTAA